MISWDMSNKHKYIKIFIPIDNYTSFNEISTAYSYNHLLSKCCTAQKDFATAH